LGIERLVPIDTQGGAYVAAHSAGYFHAPYRLSVHLYDAVFWVRCPCATTRFTVGLRWRRWVTLLVETRAEKFEISNGFVQSLSCIAIEPNAAPVNTAGPATQIIAKHYVLAGGSINSPALLLRSGAPDPHKQLGTRTFLHPVAITTAIMAKTVSAWDGAPQSIYSDHYLNTQPIDGPMGFKLEVAPLHPVFFGANLPGFGEKQAELFRQHPNANVMLAMAEIQFEAGAKTVYPGHEMGTGTTTLADTKKTIEAVSMKPLLTKIGSAHAMGGCGLAGDAQRGVTRRDGVHWQLENLSILDGSLFPTSIGANPQLSIYGSVNRLAQGLAKRLTGKEVTLAQKGQPQRHRAAELG